MIFRIRLLKLKKQTFLIVYNLFFIDPLVGQEHGIERILNIVVIEVLKFLKLSIKIELFFIVCLRLEH